MFIVILLISGVLGIFLYWDLVRRGGEIWPMFPVYNHLHFLYLFIREFTFRYKRRVLVEEIEREYQLRYSYSSIINNSRWQRSLKFNNHKEMRINIEIGTRVTMDIIRKELDKNVHIKKNIKFCSIEGGIT